MTALFDLHGKTTIITGASSGLGEQFARSLSGAGARVILAARRIDKLNTLASELNNAGIAILRTIFEEDDNDNLCYRRMPNYRWWHVLGR